MKTELELTQDLRNAEIAMCLADVDYEDNKGHSELRYVFADKCREAQSNYRDALDAYGLFKYTK